MRPSQLLSAALLCSSATAWPSIRGNDLGAVLGDLLLPHKRDAQAITLGSDNAATPNPTQSINTNVITTSTSSGSRTTQPNPNSGSTTITSNSDSTTNTDSSQTTNTDSTNSDSSSTTSKPSATTFDPRLPPGGISMITPNPRSSTQYYKIGNYVTFAWNYTSLSVTPTAIDILATCTANQATYTLATNQTVSGATGAVTWDTNQYQATASVQLLTDTYTLIIHDAAAAITSTPKSGYLGTFMQFTFGMYNPQPYTDLDEFICVTCSAASGLWAARNMEAVAGVAVAAVLGGMLLL